MAILSVDLAYKTYSDVGAVILRNHRDHVCGELLRITLSGPPSAEDLAEFLCRSCDELGIRILLLDGPQGWKAVDTGLPHSRRCEKELNTAAKTGLPDFVKPKNYREFVAFSISVYDALCERGWQRLPSVSAPLGATTRVLVESFPLSAWRALGITSLPAKRKSKTKDLEAHLEALNSVLPLHLSDIPTHDELQAVAGWVSGFGVGKRVVGNLCCSWMPAIDPRGSVARRLHRQRYGPNS